MLAPPGRTGWVPVRELPRWIVLVTRTLGVLAVVGTVVGFGASAHQIGRSWTGARPADLLGIFRLGGASFFCLTTALLLIMALRTYRDDDVATLVSMPLTPARIFWRKLLAPRGAVVPASIILATMTATFLEGFASGYGGGSRVALLIPPSLVAVLALEVALAALLVQGRIVRPLAPWLLLTLGLAWPAYLFLLK